MSDGMVLVLRSVLAPNCNYFRAPKLLPTSQSIENYWTLSKNIVDFLFGSDAAIAIHVT